MNMVHLMSYSRRSVREHLLLPCLDYGLGDLAVQRRYKRYTKLDHELSEMTRHFKELEAQYNQSKGESPSKQKEYGDRIHAEYARVNAIE